MHMNEIDDREMRWLLEELCDPFAVLPLQDVASSLNEAIKESQEAFFERGGPSGVARAFWDVPMEQLDHSIGVALGSIFVLGQAAITQAVSIVSRVRQLTNGHPAIPSRKRSILESQAGAMTDSGMSKMVVIDTGANYFKHHHEWPNDWYNAGDGSNRQSHTIQDALRMGLTGNDLTRNLWHIVHHLDADTRDLQAIPMLVHEWRERVARNFSQALNVEVFWLTEA